MPSQRATRVSQDEVSPTSTTTGGSCATPRTWRLRRSWWGYNPNPSPNPNPNPNPSPNPNPNPNLYGHTHPGGGACGLNSTGLRRPGQHGHMASRYLLWLGRRAPSSAPAPSHTEGAHDGSVPGSRLAQGRGG